MVLTMKKYTPIESVILLAMWLALIIPIVGYASFLFNPWGDITTYYTLFKSGAILSIAANFLADLKGKWQKNRYLLLLGLIINIPAIYIVVKGMF